MFYVSQKFEQISRVSSSHENRKGRIYLCLDLNGLLL